MRTIVLLFLALTAMSCGSSELRISNRHLAGGGRDVRIFIERNGNGVMSTPRHHVIRLTEDGGKTWRREVFCPLSSSSCVGIRGTKAYFLQQSYDQTSDGLVLVGYDIQTKDTMSCPLHLKYISNVTVMSDSIRVVSADNGTLMSIGLNLRGHSCRSLCLGDNPGSWNIIPYEGGIVGLRACKGCNPEICRWIDNECLSATLPVLGSRCQYPMINSKGDMFMAVYTGKGFDVYMNRYPEEEFRLHSSMNIDAERRLSYIGGWQLGQSINGFMACSWANSLVTFRSFYPGGEVWNPLFSIDSPLVFSLDDGETWSVEIFKESRIHAQQYFKAVGYFNKVLFVGK